MLTSTRVEMSESLRQELNAVEPRYFEPLREAKNSSKYREFEIANSKWLKGKPKGNGF